MRLRSHRPLAVVPLLAVLAFAGCGGGEETTESTPVRTTATTAAPSKEQLIAEGDAICAEVNAAIGGLSETSGTAGGATGRAADLYVGMVESLKRLGTPQEAQGYAEFSSAADSLSTAEGEVKLAAERGDSAALETAESKASAALSAFQSAAGAYGFEACTEGPSAVVPSEAAEEATGGVEEEAAPEEAEAAPETGGAGTEAGGGAEAGGGGTEGGGAESGGGSSGGIGAG